MARVDANAPLADVSGATRGIIRVTCSARLFVAALLAELAPPYPSDRSVKRVHKPQRLRAGWRRT